MKLEHPLNAVLIDACGEAETCRLRCGKIVHRAFLSAPTAESGFIFMLTAAMPVVNFTEQF